MSKWIWNGTTADWNPNKDSGWNYEPVVTEQHNIDSNYSVLQEGGMKSGRRKVSGITKSASFKSLLESLHLSRTTFTLVDHRGNSSSVRIMSLYCDEVHDTTNLPGYTFKYDCELIKR